MKYLVPVIFLAISIQSFGQFSKGDKVLGGTVSLNTSKSETNEFGTASDYNSFGVYPTFGVFLKSNLEVGGQVGYSSSSDEWSAPYGSSDRTSKFMTFGLYTRWYFPISEKFLFALIASGSYGTGKDKTLLVNQAIITEDENKRNSITVGLRPTFVFFPSYRWGVQAGIGDLSYTHSKNKSSDDTSNQFGINYGYVNFGIAYYFRGKVE